MLTHREAAERELKQTSRSAAELGCQTIARDAGELLAAAALDGGGRPDGRAAVVT